MKKFEPVAKRLVKDNKQPKLKGYWQYNDDKGGLVLFGTKQLIVQLRTDPVEQEGFRKLQDKDFLPEVTENKALSNMQKALSNKRFGSPADGRSMILQLGELDKSDFTSISTSKSNTKDIVKDPVRFNYQNQIEIAGYKKDDEYEFPIPVKSGKNSGTFATEMKFSQKYFRTAFDVLLAQQKEGDDLFVFFTADEQLPFLKFWTQDVDKNINAQILLAGIVVNPKYKPES